VGGGIANFTDVAATFNGIIKAFREKQDQIKAANMRIFVRRGGPNYKIGLQRMKALGEEIAVPIEVRPGGQEPKQVASEVDWKELTLSKDNICNMRHSKDFATTL
jgi:succinyl-CoA synthetase beta subunit